MLEIDTTFKGFKATYYLSNYDFGPSANAQADAQELVAFLRERQLLREGDLVAPLERHLPRHRLMEAITSHAGIETQLLLNELWRLRIEHEARVGPRARYRWATVPDLPAILLEKKSLAAREIDGYAKLPNGAPYLAGDLLNGSWVIDTVVLAGRVIITIENQGIVASFPDSVPETVMAGIVGRRLREIVSIPALDPLEIVVSAARRRGELTALWLGGPDVREGWPSGQTIDPSTMGELPHTTAAFAALNRRRWR
ncbi:hypothetical protein [Sphingomonas sp.]|uniref:hypothetical protein n=1 Tax=Sphingomonas sp. TaxID=28214 RepID=UPI002DE246E3|nr:hypothetical protein [Sphingomonas sp.]